MRYSHLDMLPEKAFQPVGKRMTLEGGGGGVGKVVGDAVGGVGNAVGSAAGSLGGAGKVIGPAIQLASGSSPFGVFGGALASQLLSNQFGGGGGGGGNDVRFGTQNQTQLGGMNPASPAYGIMQDNRFGVPTGAPSQPSQVYSGLTPPATQPTIPAYAPAQEPVVQQPAQQQPIVQQPVAQQPTAPAQLPRFQANNIVQQSPRGLAALARRRR